MDTRTIKLGMKHIADHDYHVASVIDELGYPEPRSRPVGFEAFLGAIISQQISNRAAETITQRVFECLGEITPKRYLALDEETLRGAGLSQRKFEYARGVAQAIISGEFDIDGLKTFSDEDAIKQITRLRGFGVWSAEIYLMFSLGRADIFPADDLIIRNALGKLKRKRKPVTPKQARELTRHWAPYRSVGSLFLWHFHHKKGK